MDIARTAVECVFDSPLCVPYCRSLRVHTADAYPLLLSSYVCIQLQFIVCACCLLVPAFESRCVVLYVEGVRLDLGSAITLCSIFPRSFHLASWAITVIALIIGVMLMLMPLCSRKGLTLTAIYADWLDRSGIPKV